MRSVVYARTRGVKRERRADVDGRKGCALVDALGDSKGSILFPRGDFADGRGEGGSARLKAPVIERLKIMCAWSSCGCMMTRERCFGMGDGEK